MNKKIAISGLAILASLALVGVGVYALFIVNATSNGSTFSSGNPSLMLCNDNAGIIGGCGVQIPSPINVTDLLPGVPKTYAFWMYNTGTDLLDPLTAIFNSPSISGPNTLEADLNVGLVCDGYSNNGTVGTIKFNTWEGSQILTNGLLGGGVQSRCVMTVELPTTNTLDAGQTLNFNAVFSGSAGTGV